MSALPIVAFIFGVAAGGSITFWILRHVRREPDGYFFGNLRIEREFWVEPRRENLIFTGNWVVIKERLLYKQFPLTGWTQSERCIGRGVDQNALEALVRSMTTLISAVQIPFSLKTIIRQLPQRKEDAVNSSRKAETT